mmetsp:Transcript_33337/g.85219  ORF Transcript_33337/g.85219 Transcript_33337/m.85219 type:complete len:335 (-) Transcript_33337:1628-2632(-)
MSRCARPISDSTLMVPSLVQLRCVSRLRSSSSPIWRCMKPSAWLSSCSLIIPSPSRSSSCMLAFICPSAWSSSFSMRFRMCVTLSDTSVMISSSGSGVLAVKRPPVKAREELPRSAMCSSMAMICCLTRRMKSCRSSLTPEWEARTASALMISCMRFSRFSAIHAARSSLLCRLSTDWCAAASFTTARAAAYAISCCLASPAPLPGSSDSFNLRASSAAASFSTSSSSTASSRSSSMRSFSRFTRASFFCSSAALLFALLAVVCSDTSSSTSSGRLPMVSLICSSMLAITLLVLCVTVNTRDSSSSDVGMFFSLLSSSQPCRLRSISVRPCSPK